MTAKSRTTLTQEVDQFTARALRVEMGHGIYRGKTFGEIAKTDPSYLRGYLDALTRSQACDSIRLALQAYGGDQ